MVKGVLLLLLVAGVVLFAVQNLSPIALVILGAPTLALPLSAWVIGAMAAGAVTTFLIAGLARGGRPAARREPARAGFSTDFAAGSERTSWNAGWEQRTPFQAVNEPSKRSTAASTASRRSEDDWDTTRSEDWDDWDVPQPARRPAAAPPTAASAGMAAGAAQTSTANIRDTSDDDWANWEGYEDRQDATVYDAPRPQPAEPVPPVPPRRTDFEVKQEPASRSQTGSIYSYSYRKPEPLEPQPPNPFQEPASDSLYEDAAPARSPASEPARSDAAPPLRRDPVQGNVYDAEYRVIIPPFSAASDPPPAPEQASDIDLEDLESPDEDEDWGLDEDDELPPEPVNRPLW